MSQYGNYGQTSNSPFNYAGSSFPNNNKLLDVINETSRESRTEISDIELSKKFFQNPMGDYSRQKESFISKDFTGGDKFLSSMIGQTSQIVPNVSVKGDIYNFSGNSSHNVNDLLSSNKWGGPTNPNIPASANQTQFSGFQFGQSNFNASQYLPNTNQNNAGGPGNFAQEDSNLTEDTKDLSDLSLGNFKKAFHNKDNSYNLNLTKMGEVSVNLSQNQPKTPEHQKFLKTLGLLNNSYNFKGNYGGQPTDLLNLVNSNPYSANLQSPGGFAAVNNVNPPQNHAEIAHKDIAQQYQTNSAKPAPKSSTVNAKGNDVTEIEALIADLDPLELSEIAPLSDNFLDEDDDGNDQPQAKALMKKLSREQSNILKKEQREKLQQESPIEKVQTNVQQVNTQPTYNSNDNQNQYMTNFNPNKDITTSGISALTTQNLASYNSQPYGVQPLSSPGYDLDRRSPVPAVNIHSSDYLSSVPSYQYQTVGANVPRPGDLNVPTQTHYRSESQDNLQQRSPSPLPVNLENQYSTNNATSYQSVPNINYLSNPAMAQSKVIETVPNYQQMNTNYPQNYAQTLNIPTQGSMTPVTSTGALRNSQIVNNKDYYNPFGSNSQSTQPSLGPSQQSSSSNSSQYASVPVNRQAQQSFHQQRDTSPLKKAEEESDEIINKMQSLYRDWKEKNNQMNQYLNELVHSASQSKAERLSVGRDSSPSNQYRKTMQEPTIQRNTVTVNDKQSLPYDFRYSVQPAKTDPKSKNYQENFQAFMKEDLLQGIEQEGKKPQVKPEFKKFSNPIFEKQTIGYDDSYSSGKSELQRESQKVPSKIFETKVERPRNPQEELNFLQNLTKNNVQNSNARTNQPNIEVKAPFFNNREQNTSNTKGYGPTNQNQGQQGSYDVYQPKFTKPERGNMQTPMQNLSTSPPDSERVRFAGDPSQNKFDFPTNNYKVGMNHFKHNVLGFDIKKDKLIEGVDKRKIDTRQMETICINCNEFVNVNEADTHSEICEKNHMLNEKKLDTFGCDGIQEFNTKLSNIRQKIIAKVSSLQLKKTLEFKVKQLLRCLDGAIYENSSLEELNFLINEGEKLIEEISEEQLLPQESFLLIYFSRFIVILKEKYAEIQIATLEEPELVELKNKIEEYEKETQRKKAELEVWKYQANMMKDIQLQDKKNIRYVKTQYRKDAEALSDINSEVKHSDYGSSDEGESIMTSVTPASSVPGTGRNPHEGQKIESSKIRFYSLVVNTKLLLPPSHPGKDLLISDLYDECLELNIPEEKWDLFAKKKLGIVG